MWGSASKQARGAVSGASAGGLGHMVGRNPASVNSGGRGWVSALWAPGWSPLGVLDRAGSRPQSSLQNSLLVRTKAPLESGARQLAFTIESASNCSPRPQPHHLPRVIHPQHEPDRSLPDICLHPSLTFPPNPEPSSRAGVLPFTPSLQTGEYSF